MEKTKKKLDALLNQMWKDDISVADLTKMLEGSCGLKVRGDTPTPTAKRRQSAIVLRRALLDSFHWIKG